MRTQRSGGRWVHLAAGGGKDPILQRCQEREKKDMVYSIAFDAVKYKTERFDPPAVLINDRELAAAINMGYKERGRTVPESMKEISPKEAKEQFLQDADGSDVNEKLLRIIKDFVPETSEWSEDAVHILYL